MDTISKHMQLNINNNAKHARQKAEEQRAAERIQELIRETRDKLRLEMEKHEQYNKSN